MAERCEQLEVVALLGPAAAGKTTLAASLRDHVHVSVDEIAITTGETDPRRVYDLAADRVEDALKAGRSVVFDASATWPPTRSTLRAIAKRHAGETRLLVLDCDLATCLARNATRTGPTRLTRREVAFVHAVYRDARPGAMREAWTTVEVIDTTAAARAVV